MFALRRLLAMIVLALPFLLPTVIHADDWRDGHRRDGYGGHSGYRQPRRYHDGSYNYGRGYSAAIRLGYEQGYRDGVDKGREDFRKDRRPDLFRHGRYKDADRGYKKRYGPKAEYRYAYREGFESGYREGYRGRWAR